MPRRNLRATRPVAAARLGEIYHGLDGSEAHAFERAIRALFLMSPDALCGAFREGTLREAHEHRAIRALFLMSPDALCGAFREGTLREAHEHRARNVLRAIADVATALDADANINPVPTTRAVRHLLVIDGGLARVASGGSRSGRRP